MSLNIINHPSQNFDERPVDSNIEILVVHYTGLKTLQEAMDILVHPMSKVSSHYLISETGEIYCLVEETKRAWHAGVSYWRGVTDVNGNSIGIELENPGHEFGYRGFQQLQMEALIALCHDILSRHPIPARNIVGHADVAPQRKQDPGELFDWELLAKRGIGLWPDKNLGNYENSDIDHLLSSFGYEVSDISAALRAFQRHYRPSLISGKADRTTCEIINSLVNLVS